MILALALTFVVQTTLPARGKHRAVLPIHRLAVGRIATAQRLARRFLSRAALVMAVAVPRSA